MAQARSQKSKKTTTRKTSVKSSARTSSVKSSRLKGSETPVTSSSPSKISSRRAERRAQVQFRRSSFIVIVAILIVVALIYLFRGLFVVAMVNGEPISRVSFEQQLEAQSGKQVLNTIITEKLIEEEAAKRHVTVNDADVNKQIDQISSSLSKQGQKLSDALAAQGMTEAQLKDQIKYQQLIQKMIPPVTVTDAEINDYINKNKSSLGANPDSAQTKSQVKQQLTQQKQNDETQSFLNNLQKNSKVNYFVNF